MEKEGKSMRGVNAIIHLVRADFLERARRYSTLIILGVAIFVTYVYLPPIEANYVTFSIDGYRGVYNSAWVGATVTVLTVVLVGFFGFYLVKNAIMRDRRTGVGQILATTPIRKTQYTLSKMLSNWVFLMAMALVGLLAALCMQLIRAEVLEIAFVNYLLPYLLITTPMMAFIAALAVMFESIPWLSGGFGNIIFFILFIAVITIGSFTTFLSLENSFDPVDSLADGYKDPTGALLIFRSMMLAGQEQGILAEGAIVLGTTSPILYGLPMGSTFLYKGVSWTAPVLLSRFLWIGVGVVIAATSAIFFDRFDPARRRKRPDGRKTLGRKKETQKATMEAEFKDRPSPIPETAQLTPLPAMMRSSFFGTFRRTLIAELRLIIRGKPWWWFVVAVGLILAGLLSPLEQARGIWLPLAWVWPLLSWSPLGVRETRDRTNQMIFSAPFPVVRQLPASWAAGFLLVIGSGSGVILRLLVVGEWQALLALFIGAAFIPSLALALGTWSGSSKLFEVTYLLLWYVGLLEHAPNFDFAGISVESITRGIPWIYFGIALLLLGIAFSGRTRQLKN
jgi:hypothetical protein